MLIQDSLKNFKLSPDQRKILEEYESGYASVLATPGAGKTTIITHLIAKFISVKETDPRKILVLTLTESAAKEFKSRTISMLKNIKRYPEFSTIHSFCNKVLSRFLPNYEELSVLTDAKKNEILEKILIDRGFPVTLDEEAYLNGEVNFLELFRDSIIPIFRREPAKYEIIKEMVELDLRQLREKVGGIYNFHIKCLNSIPEIIGTYESYLAEQKYLDFEMMINETYRLLSEDESVLGYLREKYEFIMEDEAQDSNYIQYKILELVSGPNGNYIRVGDPNQSIFTTFTGADYKSLMQFYKSNTQLEIRQSNRSHRKIIDVSNYLVDSFRSSFPSWHVKIEEGDNNPAEGEIKLSEFEALNDEIAYICENIDNIVSRDKESTVAILTRTNFQGREIYQRLINAGYPAILHGNGDEDFFKKEAVVKLSALLGYMLYPHREEKLFKVLSLFGYEKDFSAIASEPDKVDYNLIKSVAMDSYIYLGEDNIFEKNKILSKKLSRLTDSVFLSVEAILNMINNLFFESIEEKSATRILYQMWLKSKPAWKNIEGFYYWLNRHIKTGSKGESLSQNEDYSSSGSVHILTIHKAKGLQWDAVFIPNFSKWDYKDETWTGPSEKKDIKSVILSLVDGIPKYEIRKILAAEEVRENRRVAYVALTRAKKFLFLTCAQKGFRERRNQLSEIFCLLKGFYE